MVIIISLFMHVAGDFELFIYSMSEYLVVLPPNETEVK